LYVDAVLKYYVGSLDGGPGGGAIEVGGSGASKKVAEAGMKWLGKTVYVWGGGRNPASIARGDFDCSSFVRWAYEQAGINVAPMAAVNTDVLKHKGVKVSVSDIKVGDMIFWDTYKKDGHVGIYIGNGKWIGSQSSSGVAVEEMSNPYWAGVFSGHVRRVIQ
jgi:cell wall-associated NlpC family hydrolase